MQGVVFHSLLPFHEAKRWAVSNPEAVSGVAALTDWMHSFRMHGFFLISGLLSWRVLHRSGALPFIKARLHRVLIPLVVVLLTANVAERALIAMHSQDWGWRDSTLQPLHLGALWFLGYLALYTTSLPILRAAVAASQILRHIEHWSARQLERALPVALLAGSMFVALLTRTSPEWWFSLQLGFVQPANALMYGGYFMAGALLARTGHASLLSTKPNFMWWLSAVVGWAVIQAVSGASFRGAWMLSLILGNVYALAVLRLVFWGVAQLVSANGSRLEALLVDASYTVYLLHQVVVIAAASTLAWVAWPPMLEILIIVAAAFLLPFGFHRVFVQNSPLLTLLLNGVPLSQTRARSRPVAATTLAAK